MTKKYLYTNVLLVNDISGKTTDVVVRFNEEWLGNAMKDKVRYMPTNGFTVTLTPYDELTEISDSSIELCEGATFVLHVFTLLCEELTSPRTPIPLDVSRLN